MAKCLKQGVQFFGKETNKTVETQRLAQHKQANIINTAQLEFYQ